MTYKTRLSFFFIILFVGATNIRAETYGTYHQFLQVQRILRMVNGIAHKAPRPQRGEKIDFVLGERGIDGLYAHAYRPKNGLMLSMSDGKCELFTSWGSIILFKHHANCAKKYYHVMLGQLCSNLSIELRTIEYFLPEYMVQRIYYTIEDGELITFESETPQKGLSIPVISQSSSDEFYYMIMRVYETRIPRITAFFDTKNDESELIQAEWLAYEARYNEEQKAYKKKIKTKR